MKLTIYLMTAICLQVAAKTTAQKINIAEKNAPMETVLKKIQQQSGYSFFYNKMLLQLASPVTLYLEGSSIQNALSTCFKDQPSLTYSIVDHVVVIKRKAATELPVSAEAVIQNSVHGRVTDTSGAPLSGVSVFIRNTKKGTITNGNGEYTLSVTDGDRVVFSYVGYESKEIVYTDQVTLDIILKKMDNNLSDIVIIGYGSVSQKNLTGAIATVSAKDMNVNSSSNFAQNLQGRAAGVQVTQATGQPGANAVIQIRSNPSAHDPGTLYVIDGVPMNSGASQPAMTGSVGSNKYGTGGVDQSPLNFINPNDIESIEFLKDPSAAAIYGAKAGSGVCLITTKKGAQGKTVISYNGSEAIQRVAKMWPVYDAQGYMNERNWLAEQIYDRKNNIGPYYGTTDASAIASFVPIYSQGQIDSAANSYNAMSAITQNAFTQQHNISMSGGNGKTTYFASGNYFNQKGAIIGTGFKRYTGRLNLDQIVSDKIKVGASVLVSGSTSNNTLTGGANEDGGIITAAIYWAPIIPLRSADGSYPLSPYYPNIPNPLSYGTITDITTYNRTLTSAYGEWKVIPGLTARAQFSYDQSNAKTSTYLPTTFLYGAQVNGEASIDQTDAYQKSMIYTLTYDKMLAPKHHLNAVVAYDYENNGGSSVSAANEQFISDIVSYYNLGSGAQVRPSVGSGLNAPLTSESLIGRIIYTYNNDITVQGSIRKDGLSTFAEGKKWGYFPAVSAGWVMSNEKFINRYRFISYLKLRAGYGETGNPLTDASAFQLYSTPLSPYFGTGSVNTGVQITQAANPGLTWETRAGINAGLDFGFFNDRIAGSFDYFSTTNRNLITYIAYPVGFPISGVNANAGSTRSQGYEIALQTKNIISDNNGFTWSTTINFSHYLDYWVKRSAAALATLNKYVAVSGRQALYNGSYGYISEGVFKGTYGTAPVTMPSMMPGGLIIKDIHGYDSNGNLTGPDSAITAADETLLGNLDPKFNFGIGNSFTYKNFDVSIFLSGMVQKKWSPLDGNEASETTMNAYGFNGIPAPANTWSIKNPGGNFPSNLQDATYAGFQNASSFWFVNASYLRCKDLTIGYTLPKKLLKNQNVLSSVRVSFDAQNLFTITGYSGLDPELNQGNFYPLVKSYVFSLNASF